MKRGTYGICEQTRKPITVQRLLAVPYTRYSLEGQKEIERSNRLRRGNGLASPVTEIGDGVILGGTTTADEPIEPPV
jgi:hypothetical protein